MKYTYPLILLMALHTVFLLTHAYSYPHLDSVMHFAGGVTLGICISGLIAHAVGRGWCPDPGHLVRFVLVVSLVTSGAVCWELYEWLSDHFLGTYFQITLDDTMKDLVLGMTGAMVYVTMAHLTRVAGQQDSDAGPLRSRE